MLQETPYAKAVWAVASLFCLVVLVVEFLTGSYLGVARGTAFVLATISIFLFDRYYLHRPRRFRFGVVGTTVVTVLIWMIVFWVSFFFLYYPQPVGPAHA